MEYQKIINLLDTTSDNAPRFNTKKWVEVYDQSGGIYNTNQQINLKHQCFNQIYVITVMHVLLSKSKGLLLLKEMIKVTKK